MRIVTRGGPDAGDTRPRDDGAVALVVAVTLVVLLGISAFAITFGAAYTNRQRLQTAADAAALAAAGYLAEQPGGCATMTSAHPSAVLYVTRVLDGSYGDADIRPLPPTCNAEGRVEVGYTASATTPVGLGAVLGQGDIDVTATATAEVGVASEVTGVLPYAICSANLPASLPTGPIRIDYPATLPALPEPIILTPGFPDPGCQGDPAPASWWVTTCPDGATGKAALDANTRNGCADPVSAVDGQRAVAGDPVALSGLLAAACPPAPGSDQDCLATEPGQLIDPVADEDIWRAWEDIIKGSDPARVLFPVFCGEPRCTPSASGQQYPIMGFASAWVCAFHWKGRPPSHSADDVGSGGPSACAGTQNVDEIPGEEGFLILAFDTIQVGDTVTPADCGLGDGTCDFGVRMTRLVE